MGLFKKKENVPKEKPEKVTYKEKTAKWFGTALQPIGTIMQDSGVVMSFLPEEKKFQISSNQGKDIVTIPYERLVAFHGASEAQLTSSKGFSVGGALAGGVLFGPVGALIGSQKNKGKVKNNWYASLQYQDKEGNVQELCFRDIKHDDKMPILLSNMALAVRDVAKRYNPTIITGGGTTEL